MPISEREKERIIYSILKRIKRSESEPVFLKKKNNLRLWHKIDTLYGKELRPKFLNELQSNGILEPAKDGKRLVVSDRGKEMYKRGWVNFENHWYDADYVRKYTVIISLIALIVSIIGNENIWKAVKYAYGLLLKFLT